MRKHYKNKEQNVGLLTTIIFHLVVVIALLSYQIGKQSRREESFVIDFSKQEELERQLQEQIFQEEISKRVEDMIAAARNSGEPLKNIVVDAGEQLKDSKGIDAEELYKDAQELQEEIKSVQEEDFEESIAVEEEKDNKEDESNKQKYSGPTVLSYTLDGRKANRLRIPAYKCYNSGDVTVIIKVDRGGKVIDAKVLDAVSSNDKCLRDASISAAKGSRFSSSKTAPEEQTGEILYRFIAQ